MNKKQLTEKEIRTQYITPAIKGADWETVQIREEYAITKGRITRGLAAGQLYECTRGAGEYYMTILRW